MATKADKFPCCGGSDEHPPEHQDCSKGLRWEGDYLVNSDGAVVARIAPEPGPIRRGFPPYAWTVYKNIDPLDGTRGSCSTPSAAKKATARAVKTFGYFVWQKR